MQAFEMRQHTSVCLHEVGAQPLESGQCVLLSVLTCLFVWCILCLPGPRCLFSIANFAFTASSAADDRSNCTVTCCLGCLLHIFLFTLKISQCCCAADGHSANAQVAARVAALQHVVAPSSNKQTDRWRDQLRLAGAAEANHAILESRSCTAWSTTTTPPVQRLSV